MFVFFLYSEYDGLECIRNGRGTILDKQDRSLYILLAILLAVMTAMAVFTQGFGGAIEGFVAIQRHPARLINDYTVIGGVGGSVLNAVSVAVIGLLLVFSTRIKLSGPTVAAVFTMLGFGFFGKTPLNILPVLVGVAISAKIAGNSFREYLIIALFGSALGPVVSFIVVESGLTGVGAFAAGIAGGVGVGMFLPPIAMAMLHLHQGYNLYNMGLTSGFIGLFAAAIITAAKGDVSIKVIWHTDPPLFFSLAVLILAAVLIIVGVFTSGRHLLEELKEIQNLPGRLPSDFMTMVSEGGALVNMGLLTLACWIYVTVVGGVINGPVLGGILTVAGFGAFGKNLKNTLPVVAGVVIACLVFDKSLSAPGPLLAALFSTTLAPLAGQFGPVLGVIAGFMHLVLVERTASWHGGMDLYNNGFAGGLTAAFLVAVIEWYKSSRPDVWEDD